MVFDKNLHALWPEALNHQGPYGLHIHALLITALPAHLHLDLQASQLVWRRLFNTHAFGTTKCQQNSQGVVVTYLKLHQKLTLNKLHAVSKP